MANRTCSIEGCDKPLLARGMCSAHYQRARQRGEFGSPNKCSKTYCGNPAIAFGLCRKHYQTWKRKEDRRGAECSVGGCSRPAFKRGWCELHYGRVQKYGEPGPAGLMRSANGKGHLNKYGYVTRRIAGRSIPEHRIVMEGVLGRPLRPGENVHHINGVRHDNRPENLELWSKVQPAGQRVEDKITWAREILSLYAPGELAEPLAPEQLTLL